MTTFSEYLIESFDNPYPFNLRKISNESYVTIVNLPDKTRLIIRFKDIGDKWDVTFSRDGAHDATGEGDQMRIFATVIAAIKEFINIEEPKIVEFEACKQNGDQYQTSSREKLYSRMVKRFSRSLGYTAETLQWSSCTIYILKRR